MVKEREGKLRKAKDQKINQYQNTEDKEDNMEYKNGKNRFTEYSLMDIVLYFQRKKMVDTLQFTFGGWCESEIEDHQRQFRLLKHSLRQLLYNRSKDGYYKKNFVFVPKITDVYASNGAGLIYFDVFLFLEESYEKQFVIDYLPTLFQDIETIYKSNKFFKFRKYGKIKEPQGPQKKG